MQIHHFFEKACDKHPDNIALVCDNAFVSYQELENRSNQLAHYLSQQHIGVGSFVGLLLERSLECYIAILAILKTGAAYIPLEVDYPEERLNYIFADLSFDLVLTSSKLKRQKQLHWPTCVVLDKIHDALVLQTSQRFTPLTPLDANNLCYIIYTSGSTGKPKGVEIVHKSICHYVTEASRLYDMSAQDKVYQGFSLAFDASLEELWMALANGATLVACTGKEVRSGLGLIPFLQHHKVSVFSTVPTLLSALEGTLPDLRLLILGGETCSNSLVKRWSRPNLRIVNTYGPTEATVIATYSECLPDKEVSIGKPLPGYEVYLLNEKLEEVSQGEPGELCIGGPAVARGYVNRPESTLEKFIPNPKKTAQRLYRTGDLVMQSAADELQFLGRIDDQIKLRGFRIELNEIETIIMSYQGINQAVVSLDKEQSLLVAYVILDKNHVVNISELKRFLSTKLPDYMMPALIEVLNSFPLLSSGKVNRKGLPKPTSVREQTNYVAPSTPLQKAIVAAWEKVLGYKAISIEADFFYDLGGHSLHAANVISQLRHLPELKDVSILDLYKNPTVAALAQKFVAHNKKHASKAPPCERERYVPPQWKYLLCGIGQFFGCVLQFAVGSWQLLAVILCYAWINTENDFISIESQLSFFALFLAMPLISMSITVSLKWLLLGRVKPGVYPLWGWFYYRWWLVQRLKNNVYLGKHLVASPLVNFYYRLLGAKIGKNCHIGSMQILTHDLITIGDNTSIGADARLNGYIIEDGWLKIGTITIGNNCYVGSRAVVGLNTVIGNHAILGEMSMLPDGQTIPHNAYYVGSPALPAALPENHITQEAHPMQEHAAGENIAFGGLHYLGLVFVMSMQYLAMLPGISFISYYYDQGDYLTTVFFAVPAGSFLFLTLYYVCIIVCKRVLMNKITPGIYSLKSLYYLRHWMVVKMLDIDEISVMADTLYLPMFLRYLGAKLGRGVEMGETPHIIPDLVTIEDGGFTASSVALAWPAVYGGKIAFAPVRIGKKGFVGNVSLLPAGQEIGEGGLLGCLSIPPVENSAAIPHSAWLGSPAVFLPKRELFLGFSDQQTYNPPRKLYLQRLAIEFCRIMLPTILSFFALFNLLYFLDYMVTQYSWENAVITLPFVELFITTALVGFIVGLKWLLLGKLKPLTKPIWDVFIWKNDVIEYSYNYFINPHFTNKVLGTPFALWVHRTLGTKVGKRVFTDSAEFSEFDLISIGDDVCINAETILQTHLYEDRIFKVSYVNIQSGCNVGVGSVVLYNTSMEKGSALGNLSLLMKGERLPENTQWSGIPAQSAVMINSSRAQTEVVVGDTVLEEVIL